MSLFYIPGCLPGRGEFILSTWIPGWLHATVCSLMYVFTFKDGCDVMYVSRCCSKISYIDNDDITYIAQIHVFRMSFELHISLSLSLYAKSNRMQQSINLRRRKYDWSFRVWNMFSHCTDESFCMLIITFARITFYASDSPLQ